MIPLWKYAWANGFLGAGVLGFALTLLTPSDWEWRIITAVMILVATLLLAAAWRRWGNLAPRVVVSPNESVRDGLAHVPASLRKSGGFEVGVMVAGDFRRSHFVAMNETGSGIEVAVFGARWPHRVVHTVVVSPSSLRPWREAHGAVFLRPGVYREAVLRKFVDPVLRRQERE